MPDLLSLPNEILQEIASFLPCSSALTLLCVNHQLRRACNDRLVFQNIAKRDLDYSPLSKLGIYQAPFPWSEYDDILASASFDQTIRLAFAAERCIHASQAKDEEWALRVSKHSNRFNVVNWLPHMMALGHSAAGGIRPEAFLILQEALFQALMSSPSSTLQQADNSHENDFIAINFLITYTLLHKLRYVHDAEKQVKERLDRYFSVQHPRNPVPLPTLHTTSHVLRIEEVIDSITHLRSRVRDYAECEDIFGLDQATAILPAFLLELAIYRLTPDQLHQHLPSLHLIPFTSFMQIPPVFPLDGNSPPTTTNTTTLPFAHCHIAKMATPEFLTDTWMGYYTDQRASPTARFVDSPMRDIKMLARAPEGSDASVVTAVIERGTRGVDAHGEFSLSGRVSQTGHVHLVKRYLVANWSWLWSGCLTPFGIVGTWGGQRHGCDLYFGGYFWIWKEDWCDGI